MSDFVKQIVRFGVVGVVNTVLTFSVYSGLVLFNIPYQISLVGSALLGVLFSSIVNKNFTFGGVGWDYLVVFILVYALTVGLNISLVGFLIEKYDFNPIASQAIIVLPIAALTFIALWVVDYIFNLRNGVARAAGKTTDNI